MLNKPDFIFDTPINKSMKKGWFFRNKYFKNTIFFFNFYL